MTPQPTTLRVRPTRATEAESLRAIRLAALAADPDAFGSTLSGEQACPPAFWSEWAVQSAGGDEQRTFVLVDDDDAWLGLALVRRSADEPGTAVLNAMWIAPPARRRGGTRALCDAAAAWAHACGLTAITLEVVQSNEGARLAYEAAGFTITGPSVWHDEDRTLHEFRMRREL